MTLPAAKLTVVSPQVSPVGARLDAARRAVEGRFLEAGEVLAQAVDGLGRLIASLDRLVSILDPATVAATSAELEAAAANLMGLPRQHGERRRVLQAVSGAGARLAGDLEDMRRTLAYLRVFAINIKITAGGISAAGKEFGDFAQEICDRIQLGRTHLGTFEADLDALRTGFQIALDQEESLAAQCGALLPAVPDGLIAGARAMAAQHERIAQAAVEVGGLARNIQKKMGQALAALQIGDITRQRIEHVCQALAMLEDEQGASADQKARMSAFIHRLLAAQLESAAGDFHRDVARIGSAMDGIAGDASEILRLRDLAFGRSRDGGGGFLSQLEQHVARALTLVDDMAGADRQAVAVGASAAAAAADLGERIEGLRMMKADVQQMALNTTLKCSRIGEPGKPLAVIAVELRTHAGYMESAAQAALSALDALSGSAAGLSMGDASGSLAAGAGAALTDVTERLRTAGEAVETDLAALARQGDAVVDGLRRAAGRLDLQREIGAILDEVSGALAEAAGESMPFTDDLGAPLGGLMTRMAKAYTMAQERAVHADFTAELAFDPELAEVA